MEGPRAGGKGRARLLEAVAHELVVELEPLLLREELLEARRALDGEAALAEEEPLQLRGAVANV